MTVGKIKAEYELIGLAVQDQEKLCMVLFR
jgi:hypothetical protein